MITSTYSFGFLRLSARSTISAPLLLSALLPTQIQAAPESQWVQAAWVNVYSEPGKNGKVISHWPTNTMVKIERRDGEWCLAKSDAVSGYIACNVLGKQPLTLKDLNARDQRNALPADRESRSFWIAPSVRRFTEVGFRLNFEALSAEQTERQNKSRTPVRFVIPEFEAMKRKLAEGVVPVAEQELARVNMNTQQSFESTPDWQVNAEVIRHLTSFDPLQHLPAIKASMFKRHADVLLSGEASVDAIAAVIGQPNSIKFEGKPEWVTGHNDEGVASIWDIRNVDVRYARPITLFSISRVGLVGARTIQSATVAAYSPDEGCTGGYPPLPEGLPISGYPHLKEQPLISFFLLSPQPFRKLDVLTRKARIVVHSDPYSGPKNPQPTSVLVHTLDIDQDNVPDLGVFEWDSPGQITEEEITQRYYFINVAGQWWYAGYESYGECT